MRVAVVGSINQDIVVKVERRPRPGETVTGSGHFLAPGGKGANQAVAIARLEGDVAMVGRIGDDIFGHALRHGLETAGVDVRHVRVDREAETGVAVITLDADAENSIVVVPGANGRVSRDDVDRATDVIAATPVVLLQLEVPVDAVIAAATLARGTVILNPAPATPLPPSLLDRVDILVPNRSELGVLAGVAEPTTIDDAAAAAARLGHKAVVVTLGAAGALVHTGGHTRVVAAPRVHAVDTTGAGDAFCGALADAIASDLSLDEATRRGVAAGALAVTTEGAQPSMPQKAAVEAVLGEIELR